MDKFNHFAKAREEISKAILPTTTSGLPTKKVKETKEQMSIMLTPTQKKKLRKLASDLNMSASELIGYWVEQN